MPSLFELPSSPATIFCSLLAILLTFLYYVLVRRDPRIVKRLKEFPGPPLVPFLGNVLDVICPSHKLIPVFERWKMYGGCYRMWLVNKPYIIFAEAKAVEKILTSRVHIEKSEEYGLLQAWLGTGLLTSGGDKWQFRRKLLTPAFHFKILDDFLEVFNEQATTFVQVLTDECCTGKVVNVFPYITRCALDIICETAMGKKIDAQKQRDSPYVKAIYEIGELSMWRFVRPWLQPDLVWSLTPYRSSEKKLLKILHDFTNKVIAEKKSERNQRLSEPKENEKSTSKDDEAFMTKKRRLAFLDLLLEVSDDGKVLTDLDIREEADTFMFEGHDTTAANLGWTLFLLASNPECQEKVREELDGIFGSDRDRDITTSDLAQMKYLELCVKESLRLFPSVPFFARDIQHDIILDDEKVVPAGSHALMIPYILHRDPTVFPDPEEFRPERFSHENKRHPYAYVPFSAGPRNCIGQKFAIMEEKVVLTKVLLNFILEAGEEMKDVVLVPDLILRPQGGIKLKMKRRQDY